MSTQTNERAFETQVEETLLGENGWRSGTPARTADGFRHGNTSSAQC